MGTADERLQGTGRGNRKARAHLRMIFRERNIKSLYND